MMNIHDATEAAYKRGYEDGQPKWISVKDRRPDGECFAGNFKRKSYGYGEIIVGYISGGEDHFIAENEGEILCGVTHWMPLPEPPEEEE